MRIEIYGDTSKPKILAMSSFLICAKQALSLIGRLKHDYCIIAPELSGHVEDPQEFETAAKEADFLYHYLEEKGWLDFELIVSMALGGTVVMHMLNHPNITARTMVFQGCPMYRHSPVICGVYAMYFAMRHRQAKEKPEVAKERIEDVYGRLCAQQMTENLATTSEKSIRNMMKSCAEGSFPELSPEIQSRMFFEYGSRDPGLPFARKNIGRQYPHAHLIVQDGYTYCQYLSTVYDMYGNTLLEYMSKSGEN